MSYANGTQFYNLPQTVGTDKRDWFDSNSAFATVDAALHAAVTGQAADAEAISAINASLATDEANITSLQTASTSQAASISALQTTVTTQAAQIADIRQDAEDMITANNEGAAAASTRAYAIGDYFIYNDVLYKATEAIEIGDTIVPNTNCEATNVDTEITAIKSDISDINSDLNGKVDIRNSVMFRKVNAVTQASQTYAIQDGNINDYNTYTLSLIDNDTVLNSLTIDKTIFKSGGKYRCAYFDGTLFYNIDIEYVSDSVIRINASQTAIDGSLGFEFIGMGTI